nr:hypothetical protein [Tanacetum cinerariifolium]
MRECPYISGRKSVPGIVAVNWENGKKNYSVLTGWKRRRCCCCGGVSSGVRCEVAVMEGCEGSDSWCWWNVDLIDRDTGNNFGARWKISSENFFGDGHGGGRRPLPECGREKWETKILTNTQSTQSDLYTIQFYTQTQDQEIRVLDLKRREEKSLIYNTSFLGKYKCSSLALDRSRKKVEDEIGSLEIRLNYLVPLGLYKVVTFEVICRDLASFLPLTSSGSSKFYANRAIGSLLLNVEHDVEKLCSGCAKLCDVPKVILILYGLSIAWLN